MLIIEWSDETIDEIRIDVYSLSGKHLYRSPWIVGRAMEWMLETDSGERVANGLYLLLAYGRTETGPIRRSTILKVVVLR